MTDRHELHDGPGLTAHIERVWDDEIVPALFEYISIPNVSKAFDPQWDEHGHMRRAVELVRGWCAARTIAGLTVEVHELAGLTPVIVMEIPAFGDGSDDETVLLYGHLDKQPEMTGWRDGLGPWTPVMEGTRLYGRGGADDGYAAFASVLAIEAAQAAGLSHHRVVALACQAHRVAAADALAALGEPLRLLALFEPEEHALHGARADVDADRVNGHVLASAVLPSSTTAL